MIEISEEITPLLPAATVILIRDFENRLEVLLLQRNRKLKHMGGLWVFPGGKVETADKGNSSSEFEMNLRTAVRETLEETGISLSSKSLKLFSHWTTPTGVKRRFSTWFFVTNVDSKLKVGVDGGEISDYRWFEPSKAIVKLNEGVNGLSMAPPTYVSLLELCNFSNCSSFLRSIDRNGPRFFKPKMLSFGDELCFLYAEDAAYENLKLHTQGDRHRTYLRNNIMEYVRKF